jgi:hypothetical protein
MPKKAVTGRKCQPCPVVSPKESLSRNWNKTFTKPSKAGCWPPNRKAEIPPKGFWKWRYESRIRQTPIHGNQTLKTGLQRALMKLIPLTEEEL